MSLAGNPNQHDPGRYVRMDRPCSQGRVLEMPQATMAETFDVLRFIKENALAGIGIGFIDAHLLASIRLTHGARLWTRDKRLLAAFVRLGLDAKLAH
jgi:hypothetical protein